MNRSPQVEAAWNATVWERSALLAGAVGLLDLALASQNRHSAFFLWELSWIARWGAAAMGLVIASFVMLLLAIPLAGLWEAVRDRPAGLRRCAAVLILCVWTVVFLAWLASWQTLYALGVFPNASAVRMLFVNQHALWLHSRHIYPLATSIGPFFALLLAVGATAITAGRLPRWWMTRGIRPGTFRRAAIVALLLACSGFVAYGTDRSVAVHPVRAYAKPVSQRYMTAWADQSAPMAHWAAELFRVLGGTDGPKVWWKRVGWKQARVGEDLERRQRISVDEYARRVARMPRPAQRWNVLILIVESLRPDQLRTFGGTRDVMPNLDRLAKRSLRWTRCYTQASHSNYADICPLTSHYPLRSFDTHYYPAAPPYPCIPFYDIFSALGYRTAVISSQDERWGQMDHILHTDRLDHWFHAGNWDGTTYSPEGDFGFSQQVARGKLSGKIDDAITVAEAIRWIESDRSRPFAAYINLQNSHVPYVVPDGFPRRFTRRPLDFTIGFNSYPPERTPQVRDAYADSLHYVDWQLGRLFASLRAFGQLESTLIVVTGDTGQAFYEHGFAAHANEVYDELMRVPLIIHVPGGAPRERADLAQHVDIVPTLFDLMGLPEFPSFQGRSLLEAGTVRRAYLTVQSPMAHQVGIVEGPWKLILDLPTHQYLLYHLGRDPAERHPCQDAERTVVQRLQQELLQWCRMQFEYYSDEERMRHEFPPRDMP